jgi:hypothetical protein
MPIAPVVSAQELRRIEHIRKVLWGSLDNTLQAVDPSPVRSQVLDRGYADFREFLF